MDAGVSPSQGQDLTIALAELPELAVDRFLQPVRVPLDGSPAFHPQDAIHELHDDVVGLLTYVSMGEVGVGCVYMHVRVCMYNFKCKYLFH